MTTHLECAWLDAPKSKGSRKIKLSLRAITAPQRIYAIEQGSSMSMIRGILEMAWQINKSTIAPTNDNAYVETHNIFPPMNHPS